MSAQPRTPVSASSGSGRTVRRLLTGAATSAALLLSLVTPGTSSGFTGRVTNSTDTAASAPFFTCTAADTSTGPTDTTFLYRLLETTGTAAIDSSGNNRSGTYTATGVTYNQPGPCPRDTAQAITLDGTSGYISGPATDQTSADTFSVELWFNTTTTRGGELIGDDTTRGKSATKFERHVYMSNTGQIYFGVSSNAVQTIGTTTAYNDGAWHHVAATLSPATGMALYLDDQLPVTDPTTTNAKTKTKSGYWRIGDNNLAGYTDQPTSEFFAGSLAYTAAYTTVLTSTQIRDRYTAGR